MQPTISSGVTVHFDIFRNVCTCVTTHKDDILVNYIHSKLHPLRFYIHLFIILGFFEKAINRETDPNPTKINCNIAFGQIVPGYGLEQQILV